MSIHDPIADFLTCIRNAQHMGIKETSSPYSTIKQHIAHILKQEGYIDEVNIVQEKIKKNLVLLLKYYQNNAVIKTIRRISCPSLRVYRGYKALPVVMGGMGIAIISTPHGVMTDQLARKRRVGGEVLCIVE